MWRGGSHYAIPLTFELLSPLPTDCTWVVKYILEGEKEEKVCFEKVKVFLRAMGGIQERWGVDFT